MLSSPKMEFKRLKGGSDASDLSWTILQPLEFKRLNGCGLSPLAIQFLFQTLSWTILQPLVYETTCVDNLLVNC